MAVPLPRVRANVYALANPALLKEAESAIARVVLETLRVSDTARHRVHVSASRGWVQYVDTQQLWGRDPPAGLPDATEARRRAEEFLRALGRALTGAANPAL